MRMPLVFDSTYPPPNHLNQLSSWLAGLLIGETIAFLISAFAIYYFSEKRIKLSNALLIGASSTTASFAFGIIYWLAIGFW